MKKAQELSLNIGLILICLTLSVLILTGKMPLDKFNPETDVCLEWECKITRDGYLFEGYFSNVEFENFTKETCEEWSGEFLCLDWRPKNKCQLNPEAEGCICDEWEEKNITKRDNNCVYYKCLKPCNQEFDDCRNKYTSNVCLMIWDSCEEICNYERWTTHYDECVSYEIKKRNCIKSHLPNECEKENPDYVWDNTFENVTLQNGSKGVGWKICRKKTIREYNDEMINECNSLGSWWEFYNMYETRTFRFCSFDKHKTDIKKIQELCKKYNIKFEESDEHYECSGFIKEGWKI